MAKKNARCQAALEYLVTYGWALVMIATIIGMLIFVSGGGINTNTCTTFLTMICKGVGADGDILVLVLQNTTGQKISITPFIDIKFDDKAGYAIVTYQGKEYKFEEVTINSGDQFTISAKGMAQAETISITYTEKATGFVRTVTSKISTSASETLEISNDGIDNDGDGKVDCKDPDALNNCEYVMEATFTPTIISTSVSTIQFGKIVGSDKQLSALDIWQANHAILAFYVEGYIVGTKAQVTFHTFFNTKQIVQGWNYIDISGGWPHFGTDVGNCDISSDGLNFTISNTMKPKLFLTVNS